MVTVFIFSKHPPSMLETTTPPMQWIVEVYLLDGSLIQNITINNPNSTSSILSSLNPGIVYMVRVAGINTRGIGNYSEFATGQTYRGKESYEFVIMQ